MYEGSFKCAMEDDERRSWSVKRSRLGMPMCPPNKYSRRLKHLSLGMPRASPSSSTIIGSSLVALYFYHFMRYVLCLEHLALYFSLVCFFFVCCSNKLDPNFLLCGRETRSVCTRTPHRIYNRKSTRLNSS